MNMQCCSAVQCSVRTGGPSQQCVFVVETLTAGFLAFLVLCKQGLSPKGSATNSFITHCTSHLARAPHFVWGGMWQFNGQKRKSKRSVFCSFYYSLDLSCRWDGDVTAPCQDLAGKLLRAQSPVKSCLLIPNRIYLVTGLSPNGSSG